MKRIVAAAAVALALGGCASKGLKSLTTTSSTQAATTAPATSTVTNTDAVATNVEHAIEAAAPGGRWDSIGDFGHHGAYQNNAYTLVNASTGVRDNAAYVERFAKPADAARVSWQNATSYISTGQTVVVTVFNDAPPAIAPAVTASGFTPLTH